MLAGRSSCRANAKPLHDSKEDMKKHAAHNMTSEHELDRCSDAAGTVMDALLVTALCAELPTANQYDSLRA